MAQYRLRWPSQEPVTAPEPGIKLDAFLERRVGTVAPFSYVLVQDGHKTIELSATEVAAIWAGNPTMPTRVLALRELIGVKINKAGLIAADTEFEHMNTLFPDPDQGFVVTG